MNVNTLSLLLAPIVVVGASACTRHPPVVETLTRARDGTLWLAGTEGFAGHFGAEGFIRTDYPRRGSRSDYGYGSFPAARVVAHGAAVYLFTRHGEALRWEGGRWRELVAELPGEYGRGQVNQVLVTPDDRLLIQIHARRILWVSARDLETRQFEVETTPTYFSSLAFVGGVLHGLGWADDGNTPAVRRRDGPGRWPVIAQLPGREQTGTLHGLADLGQGVPAVIAGNGLYLSAGDGAEAVLLRDLLRRADVPVAEQSRDGDSWVVGAVNVPGHAPLLRVLGAHAGVLGQVGGRHLFWACPLDSMSIAGAVRTEEGLRIVTSDGSVMDLVGDRCRLVHPAIIRR